MYPENNPGVVVDAWGRRVRASQVRSLRRDCDEAACGRRRNGRRTYPISWAGWCAIDALSVSSSRSCDPGIVVNMDVVKGGDSCRRQQTADEAEIWIVLRGRDELVVTSARSMALQEANR